MWYTERMDEARYTNLILEEMRDQIAVIHEITVANQSKINKIDAIEQDVKKLKADMKIVKQVITDTNKDLKLVERRVTNLEQQAA